MLARGESAAAPGHEATRVINIGIVAVAVVIVIVVVVVIVL